MFGSARDGRGDQLTAACLVLYELGRANHPFVSLAFRPGSAHLKVCVIPPYTLRIKRLGPARSC